MFCLWYLIAARVTLYPAANWKSDMCPMKMRARCLLAAVGRREAAKVLTCILLTDGAEGCRSSHP